MKKVLFATLVSFCLSLITALNVYAASPTPSTPEKQIDELKDRIASRVAQLKLVERRGILGEVTDISDTQIKLTDIKGNTRFIDVDELTKFNSPDIKNFGISDIKKGEVLSVLGLYNKQSRRILARSIFQTPLSKMINGNVATIDQDNFIFNIATDSPRGEAGKKEQLQISVEKTTKTLSYDSGSQGLLKSGFSKLKENQKVFVIGQENKEDKKKVSADKIIVFPNILKPSPVQSTSIPSPVTSTGSGKKLTPITR